MGLIVAPVRRLRVCWLHANRATRMQNLKRSSASSFVSRQIR